MAGDIGPEGVVQEVHLGALDRDDGSPAGTQVVLEEVAFDAGDGLHEPYASSTPEAQVVPKDVVANECSAPHHGHACPQALAAVAAVVLREDAVDDCGAAVQDQHAGPQPASADLPDHGLAVTVGDREALESGAQGLAVGEAHHTGSGPGEWPPVVIAVQHRELGTLGASQHQVLAHEVQLLDVGPRSHLDHIAVLGSIDAGLDRLPLGDAPCRRCSQSHPGDHSDSTW